MINKLKSLASDSVIYGISGVLGRSLIIFLTPLYTKVFLPSEYGKVSLVLMVFVLATLFSVCALDNAASRWFFDTTEETDRKKTLASWYWFQTFWGIVIALVLYLSLPLMAEYILKIPYHEIKELWLLACLNLALGVGSNLLLNFYKMNRRPKSSVVFTILQSFTTLGLTYYFVIVKQSGIIGIFYASLSTTILFNLVAFYELRHWVHFAYFDKKRLQQMLVFSLPLLPAALSYWVLNSTDAFFIEYFRGKSEVGLFTVGSTLASGMMLLTSSFQAAWGPFAFSIIDQPDAKKVYAQVFFIFGILSGLLMLLFLLFSPDILFVFVEPAYFDAAWVASILPINLVLIAYTYIAVIGTSVKKSTVDYAKASLMAGVLTLILNVILIPRFGKEGSAIATVLAQIVVPVFVFYKAQKVYYIPYDFKTILFFSIIMIALGVVFRLVFPEVSLLNFGIKIAFFMCLTLLVALWIKPKFSNLKQ
ncbi:MAG: polysaccharide biosynthesis protein [Pseudarcicella sp.]|nr:polysaccharide biosynthesis protein [Pseudarcicella sp.]